MPTLPTFVSTSLPTAAGHASPPSQTLLPAIPPPPGVTVNFEHPESRKLILIIFCGVLQLFVLLFAGIRLYTKLRITRRISIDDYTCFIATIGSLVYYVDCCFAVTVGRIGTHLWDVPMSYLRSDPFLISAYFLIWPLPLIDYFIKLTFLLFFLHIFRPLKYLRWALYFGIAIVTAFTIAAVTAILVLETPRPGQSWQDNAREPRVRRDEYIATPAVAFNLATDIYILIIPIVGVFTLNLSAKRRLGLCVIFATGIAACVCAALSLYYRTRLPNPQKEVEPSDGLWEAFPAVLTGLVEMQTGIICACMPLAAGAVKFHLEGWRKVRGRVGRRLSWLMIWKTRSSSRPQTGHTTGKIARMRSRAFTRRTNDIEGSETTMTESVEDDGSIMLQHPVGDVTYADDVADIAGGSKPYRTSYERLNKRYYNEPESLRVGRPQTVKTSTV